MTSIHVLFRHLSLLVLGLSAAAMATAGSLPPKAAQIKAVSSAGAKVAVVARQFKALAYRSDRLLFKRHPFAQPMVWYLQKNQGVNTEIGAVSIAISSSEKIVRVMKDSEHLPESIQSFDLEGLAAETFAHAFKTLNEATILDLPETRQIYEKACGKGYRELVLERYERQECERFFEEELLQLGADAIIYINMGIWGFQHGTTVMQTFSKKGNLSIQVGIELRSAERGSILWRKEELVSFVKKKYERGRHRLSDFLADEERLFHQTMEDLVRTASEMLVAEMGRQASEKRRKR